MKFGIFYELQLPRPWAQGDEHRLYQNALDQIEMADRLGYDHAWQVEHHFLEEYSHSPAPESFLAAASQRTRQIRLGHGIVQLTTNHPSHIAERVATLDLLSSGRAEFGMGESASITELEPFVVQMENKREVFEEAVRQGNTSSSADRNHRSNSSSLTYRFSTTMVGSPATRAAKALARRPRKYHSPTKASRAPGGRCEAFHASTKVDVPL